MNKIWMDIVEIKNLLARLKAGEQEARKQLDARLRQLIELVKAEDRKAEAALEFYLTDKIDFLIRNRHINPADRDDLKQDALLAIFTNVKNGKFDAALGDLGGYAYRIARNRIMDYHKKIREKTLETVETHVDPADAQFEVDEDERRMIKAAIQKLPERHREVLRLHFFEDLPMNEVSEKLGVPPQKAYNLKNYALQLLRDQLKKADFF
ncbi:MAG: RNA polymerase sigma factor [bacterium]